MDFITDAEVAAFLGEAVDANLTRLCKAVEADFMRRCGRLDFFERKIHNVYVQGFGHRVNYVFSPVWPIHALSEVRIDSLGVLGTDSDEQFTSYSVAGVESFTRAKIGTTNQFDRVVRRYRRIA